jgi:hypothetical protein
MSIQLSISSLLWGMTWNNLCYEKLGIFIQRVAGADGQEPGRSLFELSEGGLVSKIDGGGSANGVGGHHSPHHRTAGQ